MTVSPENTVHVIGDSDPVLRCSIEDMEPVDNTVWSEYITDPVIGRTIAIDDIVLPGLEDKYYIDETDLVILEANLSDAGKYECGNVLAPVVQMSAELLLLGVYSYN